VAADLTRMRRVNWSRLRLSDLAVASLVVVGFFLIAISVPPLHDQVWRGEDLSWAPMIAANGAAYVSAAALVARGTRVGFGLSLVLGMLGFSMALGFLVVQLGLQFWYVETVVLTLVIGLLAGAHAVIVVGVLGGARRRKLAAELDVSRRAAAALLAGLGFALTFGIVGGEFASTLKPINVPTVYEEEEFWVAIAQFVAFAAIALNGRFATAGSLVVATAGFLVGVRVTATLIGEAPTEAIVLWTLLTIAWAAVGLLLLTPMLTGTRAATRRLAPAEK
jgi:hypothetical protein